MPDDGSSILRTLSRYQLFLCSSTSEGIASSESILVEKSKFLVTFWVSIIPSFRGYSLQQILYHWKELAFSITEP